MKPEDELRVRDLMASILGVPVAEIGAATSTDTVSEWDSILHINLILALQEAFGVQFEPAEIGAMLSYPKIVQILGAKLA